LGIPGWHSKCRRTGHHTASQLTRRGAEADSKPDTHLLSPMRSPRGLDKFSLRAHQPRPASDSPRERFRVFGKAEVPSIAKNRCGGATSCRAVALAAAPDEETTPPLSSVRNWSGVTRSSYENRAHAIAPFFTARSGPLRRASRLRAATADLPFEPAGHQPEWCRAAAP
jgi:hypothetical protein